MAIPFPSVNVVSHNYIRDTNGVPAISTFTRTTIATAVNLVGKVADVSSGDAKHVFDPITSEYFGINVEEQRSNLASYSEALDNAYWNKVRSSISGNAIAAPDGNATADKLVEDNTQSNSHLILTSSGETVSAGSNYVFFAFVKAGERDRCRLEISGSSGSAYVDFDIDEETLGTPTVAGVYTNPDADYIAFDNGWYLVWVKCTVVTDTSVQNAVYLADAAGSVTYNGDNSSGLYLWGLDLQAGAFPTSHIPTTTAAVTRNADVFTIATSAFPGGFNADEFTLMAEFRIPYLSGTQVVASLDDGTADERVRLVVDGGTLKAQVVDGGVTQADISLGSVSSQTKYKVAISVRATEIKACVNGGAVSSPETGTMPTVTTLRFGSDSGGNYLNGTISWVQVPPRALSDTDIQRITTRG